MSMETMTVCHSTQNDPRNSVCVYGVSNLLYSWWAPQSGFHGIWAPIQYKDVVLPV